MRAIVIVFCLYFSLGYSKEDVCSPTDSIRNLTEIEGVWYEYQKAPSFLTNHSCTSFDIHNCTDGKNCRVNLQNFKGILTSNESGNLTMDNKTKKITWGKQEIVIAWSKKEFALLVVAECHTKEDIAIYTRNITDPDEASEIEIATYLKKYIDSNLEQVDYALCNGAEIITTTVFLSFSIVLYVIS